MPNAAHTRRDPLKGETGLPKNKGFTIIELMIVIAVIAIITSLAFPSYRTLMEKRQVTSAAEQVAAFLSAAQMEAVKRNQQVAVQCSTDTGICQALTLPELSNPENPDCANPDELIRELQFVNLKANVDDVVYGDASDECIVFDPIRGMLVGLDLNESPVELLLASRQNVYALNVRLSATGRVSMCSDLTRGDNMAVPGYDDC
jgi:prepilin-type N-terminal cleavage/methylation domain-containing protein